MYIARVSMNGILPKIEEVILAESYHQLPENAVVHEYHEIEKSMDEATGIKPKLCMIHRQYGSNGGLGKLEYVAYIPHHAKRNAESLYNELVNKLS